jgi:GlcNAc-P-P-Und epimerase
MTILITGSNGFVGSRLMYFLSEKGYKVVGIDRTAKCNITPHPNTIVGDINQIEDLKRIKEPIDLIIHAAAEKHDFGVSDQQYFLTNEGGTESIATFANERGVKKIIYYSTVSVYGHRDDVCDETGDFRSNTIYGDSKLAGEKVLWRWVEADSDNALVTLRPTVIYGPHNYANMYNLINQMYRYPWFMIGKGEQIKSIVSLENLIDMTQFVFDKMQPGVLNLNCIDKPYISVIQLMRFITLNRAFKMPAVNIPFGLILFIGKIFDFLGRLTGIDFPLNSDRAHKFNTSTHYSAEKIRKMGYVQRHTIENEIARTVDFYLNAKLSK